jgi:hypothetical protein
MGCVFFSPHPPVDAPPLGRGSYQRRHLLGCALPYRQILGRTPPVRRHRFRRPSIPCSLAPPILGAATSFPAPARRQS